jgi:hypothetical protein
MGEWWSRGPTQEPEEDVLNIQTPLTTKLWIDRGTAVAGGKECRQRQGLVRGEAGENIALNSHLSKSKID